MTWQFVYKMENIHKVLSTKIKSNKTLLWDVRDMLFIYLFIYLFVYLLVHSTTVLVSDSAEQNEIITNCSRGPDVR